jgi:hypothetical protein
VNEGRKGRKGRQKSKEVKKGGRKEGRKEGRIERSRMVEKGNKGSEGRK